MNPAHRALRDATRPAHEAVDGVFAGFDLADRAGYARFLAAHGDALHPWETALDAAGAQRIVADWPARRRGHLLAQDLADLGAALPLETGALRVDGDPARASETDDAGVAGMLYVIEGSRLGGRFLARQLPSEFPRAYLDADQPHGNWGFLLARIDAILYRPELVQSAIDAANRVFADFEAAGRRWLARG